MYRITLIYAVLTILELSPVRVCFPDQVPIRKAIIDRIGVFEQAVGGIKRAESREVRAGAITRHYATVSSVMGREGYLADFPFNCRGTSKEVEKIEKTDTDHNSPTPL